jgi:hypothetical protein
MMARLLPNNDQHIEFEPGKLGRVDRFVLLRAGPGYRTELLELSTEPGEKTGAVLKILDDLLKTDPTLRVFYNNPRNSKYAYCLWRRDDDTAPPECIDAKILPLYTRRMAERERICNGTLKRGHRDFGFYPLEGYI